MSGPGHRAQGASTRADPPRFTIVTPSYNQAPYLRQCIDSVLEQEYPNLQYLVLDGGSRDASVEILESYGGAITWRSRPDRGQGDAVNEGFRAADGEILGWLNSDDYYLPGALARAARCLAAHPSAGMMFGRAHMVDEGGRVVRGYPTFPCSRSDLARKCYICQPSVFVRRRTIEDVGLLDDDLQICIDYDWWLRISRQHAWAFCDDVLAASRHYPATKTASRRLRALVEAGYLMREHFGQASWRWSAKWVAHRWTLRRSRFLLPGVGWAAAAASAVRFHRRFDGTRAPSPYGRKLLDRAGTRP